MADREGRGELERLGLGRTWVAIFAGWVVPGMGHVLLRRPFRGALFCAIVFVCFGLGLAHDGRLALRVPEQPFLTTLQVGANLGVGPADALARVAVYGRPQYSVASFRGHPASQAALDTFRVRLQSAESNYGTAYLWTAGLMNLLLLLDIWDIGRRGKP